MATKLDIINLALYRLGQSIVLPTLSDDSKAAQVAQRAWPMALNIALAERLWPWAMKSQALAVSADVSSPGWGYRYAIPSDCVTAVALTNAEGLRYQRDLVLFGDPLYLPIMWGWGAFEWQLAAGNTLLADASEAHLVYVARPLDEADTSGMPADFTDALVYKMAEIMAGPLIGDLGLRMQPSLLQSYEQALSKAGAAAANQSRDDSAYMTASVASRA